MLSVLLKLKFVFEIIVYVYLKLLEHANTSTGSHAKLLPVFLKDATTTLIHTISEFRNAAYVAYINNYLAGDEFLRNTSIDPSSNDLFEIVNHGAFLR